MGQPRTSQVYTTLPPGGDRPRLPLWAGRGRQHRSRPQGFPALLRIGYSIVALIRALRRAQTPRLMLGAALIAPAPASIPTLTPGGPLWQQGVCQGDRIISPDQRPSQPQDAGARYGRQATALTDSGVRSTVDAATTSIARAAWPLLLSPWLVLLGLLVHRRVQPRAAIMVTNVARGALSRPYAWLRRWTGQLIFRDSYSYQAALQQLTHDLSMARDLDTLGAILPQRLQQLIDVEFAALLLRSTHGTAVRAGVGAYDPQLLVTLVRALDERGAEPTVVVQPDGFQQLALVPLLICGATVGYICLGPKASGQPFRRQDTALLSSFSGYVAAIVRNTQLVDELRAKVTALDSLNERLQRAQEQERALLSAEIHDEPLQTALHLQRKLASGEHAQRRGEHVLLSQTLVSQLRRVCTAMRPATLEDLGLPAALDALAQEQSDRTHLPIMLTIDAALIDLTLAPALELVVYRAAQEAINNSLRHANPSLITIALNRRDQTVQLLVTDDGCGFVVPAPLSSLVMQQHLGLAGLQERVQRSCGQLIVRSRPGHGTVVELNLPLEPASV